MATNAVIAAIPYYRCQPYVRRAVESLLVQTHRELTVVVLNDADHDTPPWPTLADITDPRLIRFDLAENRGPYFAIQVTLLATSAPYLLIQDADDWSHPERVARLLSALERQQADMAVSAQPQWREYSDGKREIVRILWQRGIDRQLSSQMKLRLSHHGLFRVSTLRKLGGYYGGFRISYDMLLTNLLLMIGRVACLPDSLYILYERPDSLTRSKTTGMHSATRRAAEADMKVIYDYAYDCYSKFVKGSYSSEQLLEALRASCNRYITSEDREALNHESIRLVRTLQSPV